MDDRAKLLCALFFIICAVLVREGDWLRLAALTGLLLCVFAAGRLSLRTALLRLLLLLPVVVLVVASIALHPVESPADRWTVPGTSLVASRAAAVRFGSVMCRAALSVMAITALGLASSFERIASALGRVGLPRILVMLLLISHRYLVVLRDDARRMIRARDSRGRPPRVRDRAKAAGSMVGALFIRSFERGERIAGAMAARGFDGRFPLLSTGRMGALQLVLGVLFCGAAGLVTWL